MKPRLESAPLTDEDVNIFAHGYRDCPIPPGLPDLAWLPESLDGYRAFYRGIVWGMSTDSDKRDATLMHAMSHRHIDCATCLEHLANPATMPEWGLYRNVRYGYGMHTALIDILREHLTQ